MRTSDFKLLLGIVWNKFANLWVVHWSTSADRWVHSHAYSLGSSRISVGGSALHGYKPDWRGLKLPPAQGRSGKLKSMPCTNRSENRLSARVLDSSFSNLTECQVDSFATGCLVLGISCCQCCCIVPDMMIKAPWPAAKDCVSRLLLWRMRNLRVAPSETEPITGPISGSSSACQPMLSEPFR